MKHLRYALAIMLLLTLLSSVGFGYTLSGTISGGEWFGGITYVYAVSTGTGTPSFYIGLAPLGNGTYLILNVPEGSYILVAYQDRDGNLTPSIDDYMGFYGGAIPEVVEVAGNVSGLNIELQELPMTLIAGQVSCPEGYFGPTFLLAATDPLFEDVTNFGVLFDLTGNAEYSLFVDPGQYYVMAFLDLDFNFVPSPQDPQVFWGAPNPPLLVDVTGGSAQNINLPLIPPPDLSLTLIPAGAPVVIPPTGGSFNYEVAVANNGAETASVKVWMDVTLPSGSSYGPVLSPLQLTLPAGYSGSRVRTQFVPGAAPAGNYSYNAYLGIYPAIRWNQASFPFSKSGVDDCATGSWSNIGDSFEDPPGQLLQASHPAKKNLSVQAHPNPFNPSTVITFTLPRAARVSLEVFDPAGRRVKSLQDAGTTLSAGTHSLLFDGGDLPSGMYFYRLRAGEFTAGGKLMLTK